MNEQNLIPAAIFSSLSPAAKKVVAFAARARDNSITSDQAIMYLRSKSLSRRICDLKDAGVKVNKSMHVHPATGQRYVRYTIPAQV